MQFLRGFEMRQQSTAATPASGYASLYITSIDHVNIMRSDAVSMDLNSVLGPDYVLKSSTTSTSSTGLADLPELSFSVLSAARYVFEFSGTYTATTTTTAPYFAVNGPTLGSEGLLVMGSSPPGDTNKRYDAATAYDTPMGPGGVVTAGQVNNWRVWGYIHTGASAGTLSMRYRADVSGESISVQAGAYGRLWKVG